MNMNTCWPSTQGSWIGVPAVSHSLRSVRRMFSVISVSDVPSAFSVVRIIMSSVMFEPLKKRDACDMALTEATRLRAASVLYLALSSFTTDMRYVLS